MAIMGKKVWALMCGAIRQEFEFSLLLARLCELRAEGLIEGIVLSTWIGEVDQIPELRNKLIYLDIYLVELPPFDDSCDGLLQLSYTRQATQIWKGLLRIPDDVFVLKCRTDFCMDIFNKMDLILRGNGDLSVKNYGNFHSSLSYKIAVSQFSISAPFCMDDICYIGYKIDLFKMIVFGNTLLKYDDILVPDFLFFINPFITTYPVLNDFLNVFKYWTLEWEIRNTPEAFENKDMVLPGTLNKLYALYFLILYSCFYLVGNKELNVDSKPINILDLFRGTIGVSKPWVTTLDSPVILDKIISGNIEINPASKKIYGEIMKLASQGYALNNTFTEDEFQETAAFGKRYFGIEPVRWLKGWNRFQRKSNGITFADATKILFSYYQIDNAEADMLKEICSNKEGRFYNRIQEKNDEFRKLNSNLSEIALFTSARNQNPKIMRKIAEMLLTEQISPQNIPMAKFVFTRYQRSRQFYNWPMPVDKIAAIYFYGMYSEKYNDNDLAKQFYERLRNDFSVSGKNNPTGSYITASLNLMKEIIEEKYEEYFVNESIRNMADFLMEISEHIPFSETVINFMNSNK